VTTDRFEVPERLRSRPRVGGLAVPYTAAVINGRPDFKVLNPERVARCIRNRLCGLCGQGLGREVTFVGGPKSARGRIYTDPAVHEDCAVYAAQACPHLARDKGYADGGGGVAEYAVLYVTTGWQAVANALIPHAPLRLRKFVHGAEEAYTGGGSDG